MAARYYLLRIRLLDIEPEIWRKFIVPSSITLDRLHDVIQIVMGWTDSHLHEFKIGKKRYTEYPEYEDDGLECGKYRLGDLIKQKNRIFDYLYDFGDGWKHDVTLEENRYFLPQDSFEITCIDGERACPPEDVGGAMGYFEFCEAISDHAHEEHEGYVEWLGRDFIIEKFNIDDVNLELLKYQRWSRDRYQNWVVDE